MPIQLPSASWGLVSNLVLAAYGLGCFTTGYYLVRWRTGLDIREMGSGNAGAKNVGRLLGTWGFILTVLGDVGKGILAVSLAKYYGKDDLLVCLAAIAATAGHIWPVQLHFRGGKGMATSLGALLVYDYRLTAAFVLVFVLTFALRRKTVLPGLFAFACLPLACMYLEHNPAKTMSISLLTLLVVASHRKNLLQEFMNPGRKEPQDAGESGIGTQS